MTPRIGAPRIETDETVTGTLSAPNTNLGTGAIRPGNPETVDLLSISNDSISCPAGEVLVGIDVASDGANSLTFTPQCANVTIP